MSDTVEVASTPKACAHDFDFEIGVFIFEDKPGNGSVEVKGACKHCGVPLVFQGPCGTGNSPMVSFDRTELRAPVTFGHQARFVPGPEFRINEPKGMAS